MKLRLFLLSFLAMLFIVACQKKPEPCFTLNRDLDSLFINQPILFNASCSIDANEYSWNFGDGIDTTGEAVFHTYANPGTYDAILTAKTSGHSETISRTIEIKP